MREPKRAGLTARAPKSLLRRPIDIDLREMAVSLGKAAIHAGTGGWTEAAAASVEAMASLGLAKTPHDLVFILIKRSLITAVLELLDDSVASELSDCKADAIAALDRVQLDQSEFEIVPAFFERPGELPLVGLLATAIAAWLRDCGISSDAANNIAVRLPVYFTYALNVEWRKNQKQYRPILDEFDSPFVRAGERAWEWSQYFALLEKRTNESVFDEPFGLRQIYVPLNAYYVKDAGRCDPLLDAPGTEKESRVVVRLAEELRGWLERDNAGDAIRVISGGPGSGKSSFAKMFAAGLCGFKAVKPIFVPLHLIDPSKDLVDEVGRFLRDEGVLTFNPLLAEENEGEILLIFDGLDELSSQGKAAAETARAFVREVERVVQRANMVRLRLRVLVSGREVVVQENESEFRRPRQILNVLPYTLKNREYPDGHVEYDDPDDILAVDLRNDWWRSYGKLAGREYDGLPKPLDRSDLDEVTAQPLLNYLVALSFVREKIDFSKNVNLNSVYADLVTAVHERGYEKRRSYGPIRHMNVEQFARVLEEVGLAAWHGDGRSTTVREIEDHCRSSGLGGLLSLFQEGAQAGVTRLLAAFFFRQHGQRTSGDPTFVFTHKSFGEYLASRRVVRAINRICTELDRREESPDAGWDEKDALVHWIQIAGPSGLTPYLHSFLVNEFRLIRIDTLLRWLPQLARLFSYALNRGVPMEATQVVPFKEAVFQARNAEEALLVSLNACAKTAKVVAKLELPDPTAFGAWFRRIQGQRTSAESVLAARCLSYLDLSGAVLDIADFYGADFSHSKLVGIIAHYACFMRADFTGADLSGAIMEGVGLDGAKFEGAQLSGAICDEVRFLARNGRARERREGAELFTDEQVAAMARARVR